MQSVAEFSTFPAQAAELLADAEKAEVIHSVAFSPEAGDVIEGTGGVLKVRISVSGRGERGGAKVVHDDHGEAVSFSALLVCAKNVKLDLTEAERNAIKALVQRLKPRRSSTHDQALHRPHPGP